MPRRTAYAQGTPSWVDLQTTDASAAKSFYGGLFGWQFDDQPMPDGPPYSMALKNGEVVAGLYTQSADMAAQGVPPMWSTYIAVDNVDSATQRVKSAGGQVLMPPSDVMDSGRMSFVADPSGAAVGLWQAKGHIGATLVNEPGTVIWNELITSNGEAAFAFYSEVLGLRAEVSDMGGNPYTLFKAGDAMVAGSMPPPMEGIPNHWHVYFAVEDIDAALTKARELGANVVNGPYPTPIGPMATLSDPQGAMFSLFAPSGQVE
jgi:predicted enzyme related to lactoylglutathione lyase